MIVRFVRDDDCVRFSVVIAQTNDTRVLAGTDNDRLAFRRQTAQERAARFIRTMLAPLRIECEPLDDAGFAAQAAL